jgi:hypothetical protein
VWGPEQASAFAALKLALSSAPVVRQPDLNAPFHLYTDASDIAVGAVLMQRFEDGLLHPISFLSRKHTPAQANYNTTEREALAIVSALQEWRHYLGGAPMVHVYTDHDCLRYLNKPVGGKAPTGRLARWLSLAQNYNLDIQHIPGKDNVVADALSRRDDSDPAPARATLAAVSVLQPDGDMLRSVRSALRTDPLACAVRAGQRSDQHCWRERDGLLFFSEGGGEERLFVPERRGLRQRILAEHHDVTLAGHLGRDKTLASVSRLFYWPGLRTQVAEYVQTCPTCQADKQRSRPTLGLLHPLPVPQFCWQHMGLDLVTHLPRTARGHDCRACWATGMS